MTDEEKEAIKRIKSELDINEFMPRLVFNDEDIKIVINLIEKQSKEIERLEKKNKRYEKIIEHKDNKCEELLEFVEIEKETDYVSKDTIKSKIEEVDKDENASIPDFIEYAKEYATQKLQSLLEKE